MKELNQDFRGDQIELVGQNEARAEEKFIGSMRLQPGTYFWEMDKTTLRFKLAEMEDERIEVVQEKHLTLGVPTGKLVNVVKRNLVSKDNCWYCVASNWKNAKRKFLKRIKNETDKTRFAQANQQGSEVRE